MTGLTVAKANTKVGIHATSACEPSARDARGTRVIPGARGIDASQVLPPITHPNAGARPDKLVSGSADRNFRMACVLALGLALGSAAALIVTPHDLVARDDGVFEVMAADARNRAPRSIFQRATFYAQPPSLRDARGSSPEPFVTLPLGVVLNRDAVQPVKDRRATAAKRQSVTMKTGMAASGSRRTICVRMCDGYAFPIGDLASDADLPGHAALCQATCPDAPVRLFTVAAGAEEIDGAVGGNGKTYGSLPMAFAYQNAIDSACTCARPGVSMTQRVALTKDFTLRPGDAVVTRDGARVFTGDPTRMPHMRAAFADFRQSDRLTRNERREIDLKLGVSQREALTRQVARDMTKDRRVREANARAAQRSERSVSDMGPVIGSSGARDVTYQLDRR